MHIYTFNQNGASRCSWRRRLCILIGGNRWMATESIWQPWKLMPEFLRTLAMILSAFICRFLSHAIDGREWGGLEGGCADVWCSRCFFWYARVPLDDLPFAKKIVDTTIQVNLGPSDDE